MPHLHFKGKTFVQNHHLAVPFHELIPDKAKGLSAKPSLHDNLIVQGDNLKALNANDGCHRRFVLIECENYADTVTAERVRRVMQGVSTAKDAKLKAGYGVTFSYFSLGEAMEKQRILDGAHLPSFESLAAYVYFTATGEQFEADKIDRATGFIGESRNYDVFLIYEENVEALKDLALDLARAKALPNVSGKPRLVFAPTKYLDESYVYAFQRKGSDLLKDIRKGFGLEGLGDLQSLIALDGKRQELGPLVVSEVKGKYKEAARRLILPAFMIRDGSEWRPVHYETDILARVPWGEIDPKVACDLTLRKDVLHGRMRLGLYEQILQDDPEFTVESIHSAAQVLDYAFAACHLVDVCPNPWRGNEMVRFVFEYYLKQNTKEVVTDNFVFILEHIREMIAKERDRLAHGVFEELLKSDTMRFMVVTENWDFNRLPKERKIPAKAPRALKDNGKLFQMNLFEDVLQDDLNDLENAVASYMEDQEELFFWFRNAPRKDYRVQGWKRERIYADFIFTLSDHSEVKKEPYSRIYVVETKGVDLKNEDTDYKRSVFSRCTELAKHSALTEFVPEMKNKRMRFEVIAEEEWQTRLNAMLETP